MAWKSILVIGVISIVAVAIVFRVGFLRNLVTAPTPAA
jgi:hypothetical protein